MIGAPSRREEASPRLSCCSMVFLSFFARGEVIRISERRNSSALHRGDALHFKEDATYKKNDRRKKLLQRNKKSSASTNKLMGVLFLSSDVNTSDLAASESLSSARPLTITFDMTLLNHSKGFCTWSENGLCV